MAMTYPTSRQNCERCGKSISVAGFAQYSHNQMHKRQDIRKKIDELTRLQASGLADGTPEYTRLQREVERLQAELHRITR